VTSPRPPITFKQVRASVGALKFHRDISGVGFDFDPSMGLVAKAIDKLGLEFTSFREPLVRSIRLVLMPSIRKNFDVGGRPEPWEPLAAFTIQQRGYDAWPILVRSGKLRKIASSFQIWSVGVNGAIIEGLPQSVWYGAIHQGGYGGFGGFMKAAEKELGTGATPREVTQLAFEMLSEKRGDPKKHARSAIPQRRFIIMQDEDVEKIKQIFLDWLGAKVEEAENLRGV